MLGLKRGWSILPAVLLAAAIAPAAAEAQAPPDYGPDVLVISEPVLAALEKGLRTEIALRAELRKQLAALKTKAEYQSCTTAALSSPESAKITEYVINMPEDMTPGEMQRRSVRATRAVEVFFLRKCGPDPNKFNETWRAAQLREIEEKAAAAAGPLP